MHKSQNKFSRVIIHDKHYCNTTKASVLKVIYNMSLHIAIVHCRIEIVKVLVYHYVNYAFLERADHFLVPKNVIIR